MGCHVTGIDVNDLGVAAANDAALKRELVERVSFTVADATRPLPFADESFDAVGCVDSANHLPDRPAVLAEWRRVLRRAAACCGPTRSSSVGRSPTRSSRRRSSIGVFLFVAPGVNERLIDEAGLRLLQADDETAQIARVASRWHDLRKRHRAALLETESPEQFDGLQAFFAAVRDLTAQRSLLRIAYLCQRPEA
jgi:ubiquinone/menaquinone biosynthesis C-methylase UbiE